MRVVDTPITELGFAGVGVGAAMVGLRPDRRVHDLELRAPRHRPDREHRGEDALHVGRPGAACPIVFRGPGGAALQLAAQHSQAFESWLRAHPGPQGRRARARRPTRRGCSRAPSATTTRWCSSRARCSTTPRARCPRASTSSRSARPTSSARAATSRSSATRRRWRSRSRPPSSSRRTASQAEVVDLRTIRPLDVETIARLGARRRTARVVVEEGWPFAGVGAQVVDDIQREVLRRARRAGPPRHRRRRPDAVQQAPREGREGRPAQGRRGGASAVLYLE